MTIIYLSEQTFTNQADIVPPSGTAQIINNEVANTLAGDDSITGTGINENGIYNQGTINTDNGNDIITGKTTGTGYIMGIYSHGVISTGNGSDIIVGNGKTYGVFSDFGTIDTGNGNDTITGEGEVGFSNQLGTINTGNGNDIITGTATGSNFSGMFNSGIINIGKGNDTITVTGDAYGIFIYEGTILGDDGDDTITGSGNFLGIYSSNGSSINTGNGKDIVDALTGGFGGNGITSLGNGDDDLKGFGSGRFDGGNGNQDQMFLGAGTYTVSATVNTDGFYTVSNGSTDMFVKNFELIGSASSPANAFSFSSVIGQTFMV